jgi:hypothetical protein
MHYGKRVNMAAESGNQAPPTKTRGLGIDQLWLLVILAGFGVFISLTPLVSNDFWWHLKIGQLTFQNGAIPTTNLFSWSIPADTPFTYGAWLGEYLMYLFYRLGKLELVIFSRTVMALIAFWLLAYEARRRSGSWRIAALVTAPACIITMNNLIVRPQNWSWLPFIVFYILLSRFADRQLRGRWLMALPLIMIFWVNAHGAFILGLVLVGIYFVGEALRAWVKLPGALTLRNVSWIAGIGLFTGLATLINPRFTQIIGYVVNMMTDKPSQGLIVEWQSPTPNGIANTAFYILILIVMLVLIYSRYRPTPTELLLIIGFLWLAWSGQRYVVWFGMVTIPILGKAIANLPVKKPSFEPQRNWLNAAIAGLLFVPVLLVQPWFVEKLPLPSVYRAMIWHGIPDGPLVDVETPVKAIEYLRAHPGGKLFNEMGYGSYLIWALPEQMVFIDPRVELYPLEQWQDYILISRGTRYNELLDKYGADRIILDTKLQKELAGQLPNDPRWRLEYEDDRAQVWIRAEQIWTIG